MMYEFQYPLLLFLIPAPILIWLFLPPYRERQASIRIPFFENVAALTGRRPTKGAVILRRNILQRLVAPIAWILMVAALARPVLVEPPIQKIKSGRDLLLAVDLSGSMETRDMEDNSGNVIERLEAVKQVLGDFIARRKGDRIGLIFFGNAPYLQAPFTMDHELVQQLLDEAQVAMAGPQTMIGDAIGLSIKTFETSKAKQKVLVMLTDGNDTNSKVPPNQAAKLAASAGVTIHTIGFGDPRSSGEDLFNEAALKEIARITGGSYLKADNRQALLDAYQKLDEIEPQEFETLSYRPVRPLYFWPLGAAGIMLVLYHFLMAVSTLIHERKVRHV
jgi:Ca-activated chloride channel homolog